MMNKSSSQKMGDAEQAGGTVSITRLGKSGLNGHNFRKIAPNGFGDPHNCYPHGMTWFNDCLFVGTTRANLANRAKQVASNTPKKLGEKWPVRIPDNYFDNDLRAEIWRYHPPTEKWTRVYTSPLVTGVDGYEVPISVGFRCMVPFKSDNELHESLYAPTWGSHQTPGTLMLRSVDGDSFEVVSEPGLGIRDNAPRSLRGIIPFNNYLFTSPVVGQKRLEPNIAGAAIVYASSEPNGGHWHLACEPHFGNPNNVSVFHMAEFDNHLYAGTLNVHEGFEIWKTKAEGSPPFEWRRVLSNGAYRGKLNQMAMTLRPFGEHLYVGSAIQHCSWDTDNQVGPAPPEVIRIHKDDSWDLITGDPRITPDGLKTPLSGLGAGFGNPFSGYIWAMCEHQGWLYIATAVWAVFLRYAGRTDRWPKHIRSVFETGKLDRIIHNYGGCDLWRSRDGRSWQPVTVNGFGNCFNIGFRNMVSSPYGLFVGAANPFSPEVAVNRVAGWNYEPNPRGGLEIWQGSRTFFGQHTQEIDKHSNEVRTIRNRLLAGEQEELSQVEVEGVIKDFFGGTNFRHFGFWRVDIKNQSKACENLMDEVLAYLPERCSRVLDIDCSLGATTAYLANHIGAESLTGITHDAEALDICSKSFPALRFQKSKSLIIDCAGKTVDYAIWVRGFTGTEKRKNMLSEMFRILKPGGRIVCFDWLPTADFTVESGAGLQSSSDSREKVRQAYIKLLAGLGYDSIDVTDVTDQTLTASSRYTAKYLGLRRLAGQVDAATAAKAEAILVPQLSGQYAAYMISAIKAEESTP